MYLSMDIHVTVRVMCFVVVSLPCGLAANEIINLIMLTLIIIPGIHCYTMLFILQDSLLLK